MVSGPCVRSDSKVVNVRLYRFSELLCESWEIKPLLGLDGEVIGC